MTITSGVEAQEGNTLSVAPAIIDLALEPGEVANIDLLIRNSKSFPQPVSISPQSLLVEDEFLPNQNRKSSDASDWISVPENKFVIKNFETKKLTVSFNTPLDATPGGHYAQISIRGLTLESTEIGSSIVLPEVIVTVIITVSGETTSDISFDKEWKTNLFHKKSENESSDIFFKNNGNIHDLLIPNFVVLKDDKEVYRQPLTPKIILPGTIKKYTEELQYPEDYGVYEVFIESTYANGQRKLQSDKITILVTPAIWQIAAVGFFTILIIYLYQHRKHISAAWSALTEPNL